MSYFGNAELLKLFGSYNTILGTEEAKNCRLCDLLDPSFAITLKLKRVDETGTFIKGGTNPFVDLVSNILVINKQQKTNEAIVFNKLPIFEDIEPVSYELPICYVAINIQIRAYILLELVKFADILESLLVILRMIVIGLHGVLIEKLSGDNYGEIRKLFTYISHILIKTTLTNGSQEEILKIISDYVASANAKFERTQKITDEFVSNSETSPVGLDDTVYG